MAFVLADTSVWVEFFRGDRRARELAALLANDRVVMHPWVLGELTLGSFAPKGKKRKKRSAVIEDLERLPTALTIDDRELLRFVEHHGLAGRGIGWVDAQLLASTRAGEHGLWTLDRKLAAVATDLGVTARSVSGSAG